MWGAWWLNGMQLFHFLLSFLKYVLFKPKNAVILDPKKKMVQHKNVVVEKSVVGAYEMYG